MIKIKTEREEKKRISSKNFEVSPLAAFIKSNASNRSHNKK